MSQAPAAAPAPATNEGARNQPRFFYVHVMKTGGRTLRTHIRANFKPYEFYPLERFDPSLFAANHRIDYLTSLPAERLDRIRVFTGHFPPVALDLLGIEATTLTTLRDPVDRTISYLRHCKHFHEQHHDLALEEIYEDPFYFPCFIKDHQAKLFAMTTEDEVQSCMDVLEVDARRLEIAKARLEQIDAIGLQERFDEFLAELESRFGWRFGPIPDEHVIPGPKATAALRRRIAEDNQADMEFYEHARRLYERRRRGRGAV